MVILGLALLGLVSLAIILGAIAFAPRREKTVIQPYPPEGTVNPAVPEISKQQSALHKAKTVVRPGILTEPVEDPFEN